MKALGNQARDVSLEEAWLCVLARMWGRCVENGLVGNKRGATNISCPSWK